MQHLTSLRVFVPVLYVLGALAICAFLFAVNSSSINVPNISMKYQQLLGVPRERRGYLSVEGGGMNGGLGNNLFELLTMIGIADQLNRFPYIKMSNQGVLYKMGHRIRQLFPLLEQQFKVVYWDMMERRVGFNSGKCCVFDNPERLRNLTDEFVVLAGSYFQSFKYFDHLREDVRRWLLPNETFLRQAQEKVPSSLRDRLLICVHIRRGDFATDGMHEPSDAAFSVLALQYLLKKYERPMVKTAGVIMGNDAKWEQTAFSTKREDVFVMETTVEEDLAFTRGNCEVVLITAPSSTFGFFLGYLSKNLDVYYRDITSTHDRVQNEMKPEDFFLPSWTKIREKNGSIEEVKR